MGLEGIVSKRKASSYRSGRSPDWLKSKAKCLNKAFSSARVMFSRLRPPLACVSTP
jgi:ATP-dependent DNA ligase